MTAAEDRELLVKATALQNMLLARATGNGLDEGDYALLRQELLATPRTKRLLPTFVEACRSGSQFWEFIKHHDATYAGRRQAIWTAFRPLLDDLELREPAPVEAAADPVLAEVDSDHVRDAWHKALDRRRSDPDGAITAARSLLESVCKHVLDVQQVRYEDGWPLPRLYGAAAASLRLSPSQHGEQVFKQILGGCQSVVSGMAALRNALGDAHGKGARGVRPLPRHAELAVNLAGAAALFLLATLEAADATTSRTAP